MQLGAVFIVALCACVCVTHGLGLGNGNGEGSDYTWGAKLATSTLIAREVISKTKTLLNTVTKTYSLTQAGTAKNIDYINITNLKRMRGATAEITSGGVGSTTLTVKFTSQRNSGIKSEIEVWGT